MKKTQQSSFKVKTIVTCIALFVPLVACSQQSNSSSADSAVLNMANAARRGDSATLTNLLAQAQGSALEPWAAYWELKARLETASSQEVDDFLRRYAGTYQEDRLRNDYLLLLGRQGDYQNFNRLYPGYRMRDDRDVACYKVQADTSLGKTGANDVAILRENWNAQRDAGDSCAQAARMMVQAGRMQASEVWERVRMAADLNRPATARAAVAIFDSAAAAQIPAVFSSPASYLATASGTSATDRELAVAALTRLAASDYNAAAQAMNGTWANQLSPEQRNWVWGAIGKWATVNLDPNALEHYTHVSNLKALEDVQLGWMARAALRAGQWQQVERAIHAMSPSEQRDSTWVYWKGRALQHAGKTQEAHALWHSIAGNKGFYEQLATEALGQRITMPHAHAPLTQAERMAARNNPGLQRAIQAYNMGLRSEGTREWNYTTNLHQKGGMNDRELLGAADMACNLQWWDRCINTSERTKELVDMETRFPQPYRDIITRRAQENSVDPALALGLIRQESRFSPAARSGVGAAGLMQVMPGTAQLVARRAGIPADSSSTDGNVRLGTAYMRSLLDQFNGSEPMAVAGYNAGPGRPRNWSSGPTLEGAIWTETIPFSETRDYVKKVTSNAVNYALLLSGGQPQSLVQRLGKVGDGAPVGLTSSGVRVTSSAPMPPAATLPIPPQNRPAMQPSNVLGMPPAMKAPAVEAPRARSPFATDF